MRVVALMVDVNIIVNMSMVDVFISTAHLTQQELREKDKGILPGLVTWISHAAFDPTSNVCIGSGLAEKWALLLEMDLIKKVRASFLSLNL
jgi:hypothetical protein